MKISAIDFVVVAWITATIVLLFVFARYAWRCWREGGLLSAYAKMSFFNGLVIHHVGNLVLTIWFWVKVHRGEFTLQLLPLDAWIIIAGCSASCCGVLYKVRVFTDSAQELVITSGITLILAALSIFALY